MLSKHILDSIQSGDEKEVYSKVTYAALYMATGGYLKQGNQLLTELWKYNLPHDRNTWLPDIAFMVLWEAAGKYPDRVPFALQDIEFIEKNIRRYIAMDRWGYKMPDREWTALSGQDLLRKAYITAAMVKTNKLPGLTLSDIMDPAPGENPGGFSESLDKKIRYYKSLEVEQSDVFPFPEEELKALAMLEKLASEKVIFCEGFALGAELAARHGKTDTAVHLAKIWANGFQESPLGYNFPLLACGRHVAPLLLHGIVAEELKLSESIVNSFLDDAITVLDTRLLHGRSLVYGHLKWKDLIEQISKASIALSPESFEQEALDSGWIGFQGAGPGDISSAESRLRVSLPEDYKSFLQISNGIQPFLLNNPALLPIEEIDFIKNILTADEFNVLTDFSVDEDDPETFEDYLSRGIMISRYPDEQMVWLISPKGEKDNWQTWFFAFWFPGESRYPGFRYYIEDQIKDIGSYNGTGD